MVMIPTDVGIQVRSQQTEPGLLPVRAVPEISADLPELRQGQVFRARIQEVLPENTYKALVAGRSLTLSLPEGAKAGDTLELVVIDRTPRAIVAQTAERGLATAGEPYQYATFSLGGRLIASLLARDGQPVVPAALTRGRPVLTHAPENAAALARSLPAQLAQAVSTSGLFYEAHQVQWALGQWSRTRLLAEPQGEYSRDGPRAAWGATATAEQAVQQSALTGRREAASSGPSSRSLLQTLFGGEANAAGTSAAESEIPANQALSRMIPEDLRPLVQQQLEAVATQRLAWHGEIWPEQPLDWEIQREAAQGGGTPNEDAAVWSTNLRLSLPRLGEIDARVHLSGQTLRVEFRASEAASENDLRSALPALQQGLAAAGLTLVDVKTRHGQI
ncbi:MAG: flagellar hook-length control protein FliK [Sulfuritalea sp.]|nr:flagellar hook-length control protein FliK [Sulfuritalea sp.]